MRVYLDLIVLLNMIVDLLLLLGTNRLTGYGIGAKRCAIASAFGGVYAGACLLPGMFFLGNLVWRIVSLCLIGLIAFGINRGTARRSAIFVLLSMAMGGLALSIGRNSFFSIGACGLVILVLCRFGAGKIIGSRKYIPVELVWNGKRLWLSALQDTGNTLTDPITGEAVLIAGSDVGEQLLGLTRQELMHPVELVASGRLAGLRLIPYHSVGQTGSMLAAMRFYNAKIGDKTENPIVAFAPNVLAKGEVYRMLAGGIS